MNNLFMITKYKEYTGKKINYLTFTGAFRKNKYGQSLGIFLCDCGKQCYNQMSNVLYGRVSSCGCMSRIISGHKIHQRFLINKGTVFGYLTVDNVCGQNSHGERMYACHCRCGKRQHKVRGSLLKDGSIKSCGCSCIQAAQKRHKTIVIGEIYSQIYKVIKKTQKRQNKCVLYQCLNIRTNKTQYVRSGLLLKDPVKIFANKIRKSVSGSIKTFAKCKNKTKVQNIIGCRADMLMDIFQNLLTHEMKKEGYSIDHICPCSQAKTKQQVLKLQHYSNLTPMLLIDNISKGNRKTKQAQQMCRVLLGRQWINQKDFID